MILFLHSLELCNTGVVLAAMTNLKKKIYSMIGYTFLPSIEDLCHSLSLNKVELEDSWQVSLGSEVCGALTNVEENAPPLCTDGIF